MGRFPRLPLTAFERPGVVGRRSLSRDQLACCDLATDRQQHVVRERHAFTVSRVGRRYFRPFRRLAPDSNLSQEIGRGRTLRPSPSVKVVKAGTDAKVLRTKFPSIGRAPTRVLLLNPALPATFRMVLPLAVSAYVVMYPRACAARM